MAPTIFTTYVVLMAGQLSLQIDSGLELDTNVRRQVSNNIAGAEAQPDGVARLQIDQRGRWRFAPSQQLWVNYSLGTKLFGKFREQDEVAHALILRTQHQLSPWLNLSPMGYYKASHLRNSNRDYRLGMGGLSSFFNIGDKLSLSLAGEVRSFDFTPQPCFSYLGAVGRLNAQLRVTPEISLYSEGAYNYRHYPRSAQRDNCALGESQNREDREPSVLVGLRHTGSIRLGLNYRGRFQRSNNEKFLLDRHRISAQATASLPWRLILLVRGALQFNGSPETEPTLEDNEARSFLQLQLTRSIGESWGVNLRYTLVINEFATQNETQYLRQTIYGGLSFRTKLIQ